jgi:hypothetical protein
MFSPIPNKPVIERFKDWLDKNNHEYSVDGHRVICKNCVVVCIDKGNEDSISVADGEKALFSHSYDRDIDRIDSWLNRKPTLRIEKLHITAFVDPLNNMYTIQGVDKKTGDPVVTARFRDFGEYYFWGDLTYHTHYVPGYISKCMSMLKSKTVYAYAFTEHSAFVNLGFTIIEKTNAQAMCEFLGINGKAVYDNPEQITLWKLKYDRQHTL